MTNLAPISSFCGLCLLLIIGKTLRMKVSLFQKLYLPSSVIGGLLGLTILQISKLNDDFNDYLGKNWSLAWDSLAGILINLVFASLFLGVHIPRASTVWKKAGPQLMYGMVVAIGLELCGGLITATLLVPAFGVPDLYSSTLPIGFTGGHGTAAGLSDSFDTLGYEEGGDVSLAMATVGLVLSVLLGVGLVNLAARRGWAKKEKMDSATNAKLSIRGVYPVDKRPLAGVQTVSADSIDVLSLHLSVVGMAVLFGYAIKQALIAIENTSSKLQDLAFLSGFPLFPLAMGGGILIQWMMERHNTETRLIDAKLMERIAGTSLDFLVCGAVAAVDVSALENDLAAFMILLATGIAWHFFALLVLAPRLLPNHWFERGIAEFGMSMGVIASGLVLLRMVDPESKTPVPADFAYKQLLHSPIMGGGIWTAASLPFIHAAGLWVVNIFLALALAGWIAVWYFHFRPQYDSVCNCRLCASSADAISGSASDLTESLLGDSLLASSLDDDDDDNHVDYEMQPQRRPSVLDGGQDSLML